MRIVTTETSGKIVAKAEGKQRTVVATENKPVSHATAAFEVLKALGKECDVDVVSCTETETNRFVFIVS